MSKPQGIVRPLGLALVLAIGFGTVFALAVAWGISIWESLRQRDQSQRILVVRADGTPLIQRYTCQRRYQTRSFHALDGSEVPDSIENESLLQSAYLAIARHDEIMLSLTGGFSHRAIRRGAGAMATSGTSSMTGPATAAATLSAMTARANSAWASSGATVSGPDLPPVEQWFPMDGAKLASHMAFSRGTLGPYYGYYGSSDEPRGVSPLESGNDLREPTPGGRSAEAVGHDAHGIARPGCRGNVGNRFQRRRPADDESPRFRQLPAFGGADNGPGPRLRRTREATRRVPASRRASRPTHRLLRT